MYNIYMIFGFENKSEMIASIVNSMFYAGAISYSIEHDNNHFVALAMIALIAIYYPLIELSSYENNKNNPDYNPIPRTTINLIAMASGVALGINL